METYDRYSQFRSNGEIKVVPFGEVPENDADKKIIYRQGVTRLDLVSHKFYNDSNYGWLIMQANPKYGSMEFRIPDGAELRIPYPLATAIEGYRESIKRYNKLNN